MARFRVSSAASVSSAANDVLVPGRMQERQVFERRPARRLSRPGMGVSGLVVAR
jgi:hypothetical protein